MSISVINLSKNYGSQRAVNKVSFNIKKGEVVGFLGPNGAGKSTTMKMITGYLDADDGKIMVCDLPVSKDSIETKKKIGYLPEANPLYPEMYVREYLQFISGIHRIPSSRHRIEEVIKAVGLTPESDKKIGQLSKGYKQRVGLAAALVHDPEVLILDEPTSGLDPNQIIEIRELIRELGKNKTVLFSSHILQEVEAICQRVIIIHKGTIVADELLENLQKNQEANQFVVVAFTGSVDIEQLKKINGLTSIEKVRSSEFKIVCSNTETLKKEILKFSIENNFDIVSIQTASHPLESVFKSLTS
jgi:ABC-2 type transport system ATP-binding protein